MEKKGLIIQRLSYIKYLYLKGEEQSRQAEIVAGFSILTFHDAIEMFLMLVFEHQDPDNAKKQKHFDDYLSSISGLKMRDPIRLLNKCRNNLKHEGQLPIKADIERHRMNTYSFLQENTKELLDLSFDEVSLIDLVSYDECKKHLIEAQTKRDEDKWFESIVNTRKAFIALLDEFEQSKKFWYNSIFNIGIKPRDSYQEFLRDNCKNNKTWYEAWFKDVDQTINALRDAVKIISIGVNYKQYALFNTVAPEVWRMSDGSLKVRESEDYFNGRINANKELCDFCINFVIDCAVKFKDSDYEITSYFKNPYGPTSTIEF
jgi:hypothetical protein